MTTYSHGDDEEALGNFAWYGQNSGRWIDGWAVETKTHPIGTKEANPWGIHDMHGNVMEWCRDGYADYEEKWAEDPIGTGSKRVIRGGSFLHQANVCRSACRWKDMKDPKEDPPNELWMALVGFRPALVLAEEPVPLKVN